MLHIFRGEPLALLSQESDVELYRLEKWGDAVLARWSNGGRRNGLHGLLRHHQGESITQAPNLMWGTDGAQVFTGEDRTLPPDP